MTKQINFKVLKYNHAFDIAFSIDSNHPQGEDVTAEQLRDAIIKRAHTCYNTKELHEATGAPFDTYKN